MSYRIKRNNTQYEVWACKEGNESLVGVFASYVDAAAQVRQAPNINKEGLPPMPKLSYWEQLRQENLRLKAEVARLKALLGEG